MMSQLTDLEQLVSAGLKILNILTVALFVLAVVVFAWGIVRFIAASGDPNKIREARGYIIWGIIGITILASIYGVVNLLQQSFGVGGAGTIQIPDIETRGPTEEVNDFFGCDPAIDPSC